MTLHRTRLWLIGALNAGALVAVTMAVIDAAPIARVPAADHGAFYGMLGLFVLIPPGVVGLLALRLAGAGRPAGRGRTYFALSYAFLSLVWLWSCIPGALMISLFEPWPLSLAQGPDTERARKGYRRVLGHAPPPDVHGIYYRRVSAMGESTHYLSFAFEDPTTVEGIAAEFDLVQVTEAERNGALVGFAREYGFLMSWWQAERINAADRIFVDRDTRAFAHRNPDAPRLIGRNRRLWIDAANRRAYLYQHEE